MKIRPYGLSAGNQRSSTSIGGHRRVDNRRLLVVCCWLLAGVISSCGARVAAGPAPPGQHEACYMPLTGSAFRS